MIRYFLILCLLGGMAYIYVEAVGEIDIANQVTQTMIRKSYYTACMESSSLPRDQASTWCLQRTSVYISIIDLERETEQIRALQEINQNTLQ